jgi:short-subunit dehydrogenase
MKTALVTGASSGIGLATTKALLSNGYRVIGLARDFSKAKLKHEQFQAITTDLLETKKLPDLIKLITPKEGIDLLINCAGVGYFAQHQDVKPEQIEDMVTLNLSTPMLLTKLLMPALLQRSGTIINIASASGLKPSPFGAVYGATKTALIHFSESVFEEMRKQGIKSIALSPDLTDTHFFDKLSFYPSEDKRSYLLAEDIAEQILTILALPDHIVIPHMVIKPQIHKISKRKYS